MANTTPLLSDPKQSLPLQPPSSLEDTIERCIGEFGWAQLMQAILVSLAWVFDAQQTFISVFTDVEPTWHCKIDSPCDTFTTLCRLPKNSWSWDYPAQTSIISEWGLECANSMIKGMPSSSFFVGCLVGGIVLATLADSSLGRKNMLFLSCLTMGLSSIFTVFSTNVWIYSCLRFINGFGRATVGTCALVLSTELVGKKWRGRVGVIGFFNFTLGFLSLPIIAYINRNSSWRIIYLWTSIPTILYCVFVLFFVHESPRWLFLQGKNDEAISILEKISPRNNKNVTLSFSSDFTIEQETWNVDVYSTVKILFGKGWAFRRITSIMVVGFGIGMVYYGMPLGLGNLKFNLYLSVTLNALAELPASLITFCFIGKLNRKTSLLTFTTVSGICSVMCVVVNRKLSTSLQIGLELISFFSACTGFGLALIYTIELFPTCVRNSAISMVRQALVLGGAFSPVLVAAGKENGSLTYGVFGLVIGFCGLFVLGLPETRGSTLCDTIDEQEQKSDTKTRACNGVIVV